jgi:hypothetical protein
MYGRMLAHAPGCSASMRLDVNDMCVLALCHTISRRRVLRSVKVPVTCAPSSCENSMKDDICDTVSFVPKGSYPDFDGVGSYLSDPDTSLPRVIAEYFILFFLFLFYICILLRGLSTAQSSPMRRRSGTHENTGEETGTRVISSREARPPRLVLRLNVASNATPLP